MKKPKSINRIIKVIGFLMILTYILTGCSNKSNQKNEILWGTDFVKADAYINDVMYKEFGLEIPFAYTGEITDVELVSIEGENTQAISATMKLVGEEVIGEDGVRNDEYQLGILGLRIERNENKDVKIDRMIVSINKKKETIEFESPLMLRFIHNDFEPYISIRNTSDMCFAAMVPNRKMVLQYAFVAVTDLSFTGVEYQGYFKIKETEDTQFFVNNELVAPPTEDKPIKLKKEDRLECYLDIERGDDLMYTFLINSVALKFSEYEKEHVLLAQQAIGSKEDGQTVLEAIIKNEKK